MVWFRLNIGRDRNADPRWLLPLICRAGDVSKSEIGAIKIFERDTRFQIAAEFADRFADSVLTNGSKGGHISRIGPHATAEAATAEPGPGTDGAADKSKAPAHAGPNTRPESPWRDRGKAKTGPRPHRKGIGYHQRSKPSQGAPHAGSGDPRPPSKYAQKKKGRAGEPAKS